MHTVHIPDNLWRNCQQRHKFIVGRQSAWNNRCLLISKANLFLHKWVTTQHCVSVWNCERWEVACSRTRSPLVGVWDFLFFFLGKPFPKVRGRPPGFSSSTPFYLLLEPKLENFISITLNSFEKLFKSLTDGNFLKRFILSRWNTWAELILLLLLLLYIAQSVFDSWSHVPLNKRSDFSTHISNFKKLLLSFLNSRFTFVPDKATFHQHHV